MEPVSLAFGVLPVLGGAIKACKLIHKKLRIFRHYSRELRRIHKQIDRQWHFFTNEVHLLLRPAVDDEFIVDAMLKDAHHHRWSSNELEGSLRRSLGKNYEACQDVIEDFRSTIDDLQSVLKCFDALTAECEQGESLKDTVRRLRARMKVAYDESKFAQGIADLRAFNDDLKRLREQAHKLDKSSNKVSSSQKLQKRLLQEYGQLRTIREASKAFHDALTAAWSKSMDLGTADELRHTVRLFLDARVNNDVCMNVVISCFGHNSSQLGISTSLQVRSQARDWIEELPSPLDADRNVVREHDPRKRRRVRFIPQKPDSSVSDLACRSTASESKEALDPIGIDLCSKDLCSALHGSFSPSSASSTGASCLGYIDGLANEKFRHLLYEATGALQNNPVDIPRPSASRDNQLAISMVGLLGQRAETNISIVEQLELARDMVSAMLKFYSTPWLREYFSLYDLSFFQMNQDLSASLKTLHLGLEFVQWPSQQFNDPAQGSRLLAANAKTPDDISEAIENAKLQYGVRNLTLWSLGTILLQIGRWSQIESPDDVPLVRRLASQVPSLGPRYRDLTKKCLECDFGYGEDLSKPRLQQAVYEGLVYELNDMISSLSIQDE